MPATDHPVSAAPAPLPSPLVDTGWLAAHLGAGDLRVFDCSMVRQDKPGGGYAFVNGHEQWQQGHVPGSMHIDVASQLSDATAALALTMPPIDQLVQRFAAAGIGDDTRVVLYDNSNHGWAARVWWLLRVCGFDRAAVLNGGWSKWLAEGRPVSRQLTQYACAHLTAQPRPRLMANQKRVLDSLAQPDVVRLLALSPAVYNGAVQLFARPGRIPASGNVHCDALLDPASNAYLKVDELRALFTPSGALTANEIITYCGGGIAACSDALALVALGYDNVAVYDGSLSEWAADPTMPMES